MKRGIVLYLTVGLLFALALAACSSNQSTQVQPTSPPGSQPEAPTAESGEATTGGTSSRVPEDVPLMPGAYNLQVLAGASQVTYQVDQPIEDVVAYYQAELEPLGWMTTRSPDSALGLIASLVRTNEQGDRLSVDLQFNPNSTFTVIQIAVVRSP